MQQENFNSGKAESVISSVAQKLGFFGDLHKYDQRQVFLIDNIHLRNGEIKKAIIEFRVNLYRLGSIGIVPVGLNEKLLSEVRLGFSQQVLSKSYTLLQTTDISEIPFFTMPYDGEKGYGFGHLKMPIFGSGIDAIIVVMNESIGGIHRIMQLHEEEV